MSNLSFEAIKSGLKPITSYNLDLLLHKKKNEHFVAYRLDNRDVILKKTSGLWRFFIEKIKSKALVSSTLQENLSELTNCIHEMNPSDPALEKLIRVTNVLYHEQLSRLPECLVERPKWEQISNNHPSDLKYLSSLLKDDNQKNLAKLLIGSKQGDHFIFKKGHCEKVTSLKQKLSYFFSSHYQKKQLKIAIKTFVEQLEKKSNPSDKYQSLVLQHIFFDKLCKMKGVFNPSWISENSKLEQALSPEHIIIRNQLETCTQLDPNFTNKISFSSLKPISDFIHNEEGLKKIGLNPEQPLESFVRKTGDLFLKYRELEADLANKLGVALPRMGKGSSGTYLIYGRNGKKHFPIGINKPDDEGPRAENNPNLLGRLKRYIWFLKNRSGLEVGQESKTEETVYFLASHYGNDNVPPTSIQLFKSHQYFRSSVKRGSFQTMIPHCEEAADFLNVNYPLFGDRLRINLEKLPDRLWKWAIKYLKINKEPLETSFKRKIPENLYRNMASLDFRIRNIDRHFGNWMIYKAPKIAKTLEDKVFNIIFKSEMNDYGDRIALICIDNASALPYEAAKGYLSQRHMFGFTRMPQSKACFTQSEKAQFFDENKNQEALEIIAVNHLKEFYFYHEKQIHSVAIKLLKVLNQPELWASVCNQIALEVAENPKKQSMYENKLHLLLKKLSTYNNFNIALSKLQDHSIEEIALIKTENQCQQILKKARSKT
ncbi:MAG: hypothetical protein JHC93_02380 [Parachlamydiales bacterium]|nr:hypothetical protein [Parachlamydiales bacterium]